MRYLIKVYVYSSWINKFVKYYKIQQLYGWVWKVFWINKNNNIEPCTIGYLTWSLGRERLMGAEGGEAVWIFGYGVGHSLWVDQWISKKRFLFFSYWCFWISGFWIGILDIGSEFLFYRFFCLGGSNLGLKCNCKKTATKNWRNIIYSNFLCFVNLCFINFICKI